MASYVIGSLIMHTNWDEFKEYINLRMDLEKAKSVEDINKIVCDSAGCFYVHGITGAKHKSVECACKSHQCPPKIVPQSLDVSLEVWECPNCY